jgi:hypothetical protein
VPNTPLRQSLDSEWFRKPSTSHQSPSSSFSTYSQSSVAVENNSSLGLTVQEGESYLSTPCVKQAEGLNVLQWWSSNEAFYPRLSQVAKDVLAIPIAQVGVERVFNTAKDVIGDRRHRLSAQVIRQIMILKDTIQLEEPKEEGLVAYDEVDDLLELPACIGPEDPVENEEDHDSSDQEPVTPSRREQRPRKRVKPSRYRDDIL